MGSKRYAKGHQGLDCQTLIPVPWLELELLLPLPASCPDKHEDTTADALDKRPCGVRDNVNPP